MSQDGFVKLPINHAQQLSELNEHGLYHAANHEFFAALHEVLELLRMEALIRECHPIHERLVSMQAFIAEQYIQDYIPDLYPEELVHYSK